MMTVCRHQQELCRTATQTVGTDCFLSYSVHQGPFSSASHFFSKICLPFCLTFPSPPPSLSPISLHVMFTIIFISVFQQGLAEP